jgi:16S rRNA C1402 N4-methylase RsmH
MTINTDLLNAKLIRSAAHAVVMYAYDNAEKGYLWSAGTDMQDASKLYLSLHDHEQAARYERVAQIMFKQAEEREAAEIALRAAQAAEQAENSAGWTFGTPVVVEG